MDQAFLIRLAVTLAVVGVIVAITAWAKISRPSPALDENQVRRILADDFPQARLDRIWIALDQQGALVRSCETAIVLFKMGDGYVSRSLDWSEALAAKPAKGRFWFNLHDFSAPKASLALSPGWPHLTTGETA